MRPTSNAPRIRRPSGRWMAALLITATVALLAPGVSWTAASRPSQPSQATLSSEASLASTTAASCKGITPASFPAQGFITGPAHTQGGHMWWRSLGAAGVCVGTVVEQVWYTTTATKTWKVIIYSARHPGGLVVARATFTLRPGFYFWGFRIRHAFQGLSAVCITADRSFGRPCVSFG